MPNNMRKRSLDIIRSWSTNDVVALLEKNGLSECCDAILKRQIDGEGLLQLSERTLNLWKSDLVVHLRLNLCRFVEELNNDPTQFIEVNDVHDEPTAPSPVSLDDSTDHSDWDTEFEDDEPVESTTKNSSNNENLNNCSNVRSNMYLNGNLPSQPPTEQNIPRKRASQSPLRIEKQEDIYENLTKNKGKNIVLSLQQKLLERQQVLQQKPELKPKPPLSKKTQEVLEHVNLHRNGQSVRHPQQSFNNQKNSEKTGPSPKSGQAIEASNNAYSKKTPLPPKPELKPPLLAPPDEKSRPLPEPPSVPGIKNLDLVVDLLKQPKTQRYRSSESVKDDSSSQGSSRSISSSSNESIHYLSQSQTNDVEDDGNLYETIPKVDDRDEYVPPRLTRPTTSRSPRPPPPRPFKTPTWPEGSTEREKIQTFTTTDQVPPPRPLPAPPNLTDRKKPVKLPDVPSYTEQPWFHDIGREQAIALIQKGSPRFPNAPPDGYFLLRPSAKSAYQPWTLVLWCGNKTWNIPVRQRPDTQYALGTVKRKEVSFTCIIQLINYYKQNDIVLSSGVGDAQVGSTRLTETPPK